MLVVEIPYESQKNYAIFYLQFQRFLLLTSFGVLHPLPKGRGLARKIDKNKILTNGCNQITLNFNISC